MKAIKTKFIGPTNSRGSRITATDGNKNRVTIGWDHASDTEANHRNAAFALLNRVYSLQWQESDVITGWLNDCYVHIVMPRN